NSSTKFESFGPNAQTASERIIPEFSPRTISIAGISPRADVVIESGTVNNFLVWTISDLQTYTLERDNVIISFGLAEGLTQLSFILDDISLSPTLDSYLYSLSGVDSSNAISLDEVFVSVLDTTAPVLNLPTTTTFDYGASISLVSWSAMDLFPYTYQVSFGATLIASDTWNDGEILNFDIAFLKLGIGSHNFDVRVFDTSGNFATGMLTVQIVSPPNPTIIGFGDVTEETGTLLAHLEWIPSSSIPDYYDLQHDGRLISSGPWSSGEVLSFDINDISLQLGDHVYRLFVYDELGNFADDVVVVTVSDSVSPSINPGGDVTIETGTVNNVLLWDLTDFHPDTYELSFQGTVIETGTWLSGDSFLVNLDHLTLDLGIYVYELRVNDTTGNERVESSTVFVVDTTSPTISSPNDLTLESGFPIPLISWDVFDFQPQNYEIYLVQPDVSIEIIETGTWGSDLSLTIDGIILNNIGLYQFTLVLFDTSRNSNSDTVVVVVEDSFAASLTSPGDQTIESGSVGKTLSWTAVDPNPLIYQIFKDSTMVDQGFWSSSVPISISLDDITLLLGDHVYTIHVYDEFANLIIDTVFVRIEDTTNPDLTSPLDFNVELGSLGNLIIWIPSDLHADTYELYLLEDSQLSVLIDEGGWFTNQPLEFSVDFLSLQLGEYEFTLFVHDTTGNSNSDLVMIIVEDTIAPSISSPEDQLIEAGSLGIDVVWNADDLDPDNYNIYLNDVVIFTQLWSSDIGIVYNFDELTLDLGNHNVTIEVFDGSTNRVSDTMFIEIVDTTSPEITIIDLQITFVGDKTDNSITFELFDYFSGTYEVYLDDRLIQEGTWVNGELIINVNGLESGFHDLNLVVMDNNGNVNNAEITIGSRNFIDLILDLIEKIDESDLSDKSKRNLIQTLTQIIDHAIPNVELKLFWSLTKLNSIRDKLDRYVARSAMT
ncbi:MAG: hypothetical protein IH840_09745, partial [Candidatus Heimdallarchaeota archaeon]|nr:hypothetical protein [Candidatus Heimdallarchaeota archaeon]